MHGNWLAVLGMALFYLLGCLHGWLLARKRDRDSTPIGWTREAVDPGITNQESARRLRNYRWFKQTVDDPWR